MLDKNDIRDMLLKECDVCVHLHGKLPKGAADYRPTPGQRSTLELLRHVAHSSIDGLRGMTDMKWETWEPNEKRLATMRLEDFPAEMARQKKEIVEYFERLTDKQFASQESMLMNGTKTKLAAALLDGPVRWATGYRMQLFLYAKAAGNAGIGTWNCWDGVDDPKKT